MRALLVCLVLVFGCDKSEPPAVAKPSAEPVEHKHVNESPAYAPDLAWGNVAGTAELPATLATFAKAALAAHKKPYVYLHAEWCPPCKAIEATRASDPKMVDAFAGTAIATIDIDAADPKVMSSLGLQTGVIPVFYKLDGTGKPTGDKIDGGAWGDNVPENMAPPLKAFFAK